MKTLVLKSIGSILCMLAFASINIVTAQETEIKNGAQFTTGSKEYIETVVEVSENRTSILLRAGFIGNKFRVLNLDGQLNEASKFDIEIPEVNGKKVKYFWSLKLGKSVYFFSRYFDKKANDYYLFASELDPTSGKFLQHKEAVRVNNDKFRSYSNPFTAVRSIDSTKILFITEYPVGNNDNARYGFKCVNSDMSEIWAKDITIPMESKYFSMLDYDLDKDGNVHFTASVRMTFDEKADKGSKANSYINIYSYFHTTSELKQYELGFQNEIIRTIDLNVNANNELVGTGFYSEKKLVDSYKGFFYLRIDPITKEVKKSTLSPFSKELLTELIGARKAEKGKELPAYEVRRTIALDNGGMAVVAEHYVYTYRQSTDQNGKTTTYETWLYGNVVVMYLDADGSMESAGVLKKRQYCTATNGAPTMFQTLGLGVNPGVNELPYYGIAILRNGNTVNILYNENPKNTERLAAGKTPLSVRKKSSITQYVSFDKDGKTSTTTLFKSKDKEAGYSMPLMPRSSIQYSKNDMIVFGSKGKAMRVSRVTVR